MSIKTKNEYPDLFIVGLTGSGKDTIADFYKSYYDYRKMRLAGTIKQVICEKHNFTPEELEVQKRIDPEIRLEHHKVSADNGGQQSSLNRAVHIANRTAFDLEIVTDKEKQIVICDGRSIEEAQLLLMNDFITIFLSRTTAEFRKADHFTENNLFLNGQLAEITNLKDGMFTDNIVVVFNDTDYSDEQRESIIETLHFDTKILKLERSVNGDTLIEKLDEFLTECRFFDN